MKEDILKKIEEAGVSSQEAEEFYNLLSEEVLDILFEDIAEKSTDEELAILENRLKEAKSTEHLESIIRELAVTAYGENPENEIQNIYLDLIDSFKQNIEEAKALIDRAKAGDPDAQNLLRKATETDTYKNVMAQQ